DLRVKTYKKVQDWDLHTDCHLVCFSSRDSMDDHVKRTDCLVRDTIFTGGTHAFRETPSRQH
ncbi:MAG TPA: hypothetical protein VJ746_16445, partial [Nitrospira sp.]|nr:hypothetical protein [Nitrospira sp.]